MPTYTAGPSPHRNGFWEVRRDRVLLSESSEAEAHIFAWAVKQIAAGRVIVALVSPDDAPDGARYAGFYCEDYSGPTEGVAPSRPAITHLSGPIKRGTRGGPTDGVAL